MRADFLAMTVAGFSGILESTLISENTSRIPGFLQRLDVRVKLITLLLFIIVAGLARGYLILLVLFAIAISMVIVSKIPTDFFLKRVFFFVPLFTLVIALPALFITPGTGLVQWGRLTITVQGLNSAVLLFLRVVDSVSFGLLLLVTSSWSKLLAGLRWFQLPSLVVSIIMMTYRYIFLLLHTANNMFLARRSRAFGNLSVKENHRWLGHSLAVTLAKSQHLGEEVYLAMLSRGFTGEIRTLDDFQMQGRDWLWLGFAAIAAMLLLWGSKL